MSNVNKIKRGKASMNEESEQGQLKKFKNDTDIQQQLQQQQLQQLQQQQQQMQLQQQQQTRNRPFDQNYYIELIESEEDVDIKIRIIRSMLTVFRNSIGNEPDKCAYVSLLIIAKRSPQLFAEPELLDSLLFLLKKDPTQVQKKNNLLSILACNLLMAGYEPLPDWPKYIFFAYLEDAIGDRYWVEDQHCRNFVNNIIMVFPQQQNKSNSTNLSTVTTVTTTTPPNVNKQQQQQSPSSQQKNLKSPPSSIAASNQSQQQQQQNDQDIVEEIDQLLTSSPSSTQQQQQQQQPRNRFAHCQNDVIGFILYNIKQYMGSSNQRAFIKLLQLTVGFKESRLEGTQLIDSLLSNQNIFRFSKEYLSQLLMYTTENTVEDKKAVQNLLKIQIATHQFDVVSQLLANNPAYPAIALQQAIEMEMDTNQKIAGKSKLSAIFKFFPPNKGEEELASILKEYASRDDKNVRLIIRKIFKSLSNISLLHLCEQLTQINQFEEMTYLKGHHPNQPQHYQQYQQQQQQQQQQLSFTEKWIGNMSHMLIQLLFLLPSFYENSKEINPRFAVSYFQACCVQWVGKLIPMAELQPNEALMLIKKFLIFDSSLQSYFPPPTIAIDSDKNAYRIITTETPIQETSLEVVIHIGTEYPSERENCLDICESLLKRAISTTHKVNLGSNITKPLYFEQLINFSRIEINNESFNNIPPIGRKSTFWQSMIISCLLVCLSPSMIGSALWINCPTIRTLIEMIITRSWKFPPYIPKGMTNSNQFEINEMNQKIEEKKILTLLQQQIPPHQHQQLPQIILLDLKGPIRQPPDEIIEKLQKLENEYHLGLMLCSSRQPDFLLEIMSNQDSKQSMVWLNPIIHNDPKTLDILPTICLSEILLSTQSTFSDQSTSPIANMNNNIAQRVLNRMTFFFNLTSPVSTLEILNFFFTLLYSENPYHRMLAKKSLSLLAPSPPKNQTASSIPQQPQQPQLRSSLDKLKTSTVPSNSNLQSSTTTTTTNGLNNSNGITNNKFSINDTNFITEDFQWLVRLNYLQWFESSLEIVIPALKKAIYIETDLNAIRSYLQYLVNNQSMVEYDGSFPIDLSSLILDRGVTANFLMNSDIAILIFYVYLHLLQPEQQKELFKHLNSSNNNIQNLHQKWIIIKYSNDSTSNSTTTSSTNQLKELYIPRIVLDSIIYCLSTYNSNSSYCINKNDNSSLFNRQIESIINILFPVSNDNGKLETKFYNFKNQSTEEPILRSKEFIDVIFQSNIKQLISIALESTNTLVEPNVDYINYLFSHNISNVSRDLILEKLDKNIKEIKSKYNDNQDNEDNEIIKKQIDQIKSNQNNKLSLLKLFIKKSENKFGSLFLNFIESLPSTSNHNNIDKFIKPQINLSESKFSIFDKFLNNDNEKDQEKEQLMEIDSGSSINIKDQLFKQQLQPINILSIIGNNQNNENSSNNEEIEKYFKEILSINFKTLSNSINISLLISIIRLLNNNLIVKNNSDKQPQQQNNNQIEKLLESLSNQQLENNVSNNNNNNNNNLIKQKDFIEYITKKALFKLLPPMISTSATPITTSPKLKSIKSKSLHDRIFDICKEWSIYSNDSTTTSLNEIKFNSKEIISTLDQIKNQNQILIVNDINKLGSIFKNLINLFIMNDNQRLEEFIGKFFGKLYSMAQKSNIESNYSNDVTIVIFNSLISLLFEIASKNNNNNKSSLILGILLDWMVLLVQQFNLNNQQFQIDNQQQYSLMNGIENKYKLNLDKIYFLLFGKGNFKFSTFLHSHFIHNSTWKNLKIMIHWLFKVNGNSNSNSINDSKRMIELNPSLVLSFVNAYHQHPRSGAPYYSSSNTGTTAVSKSITNMSTIMDSVVMHYLNPSTIRILSDYIVEEMDNVKILSPQKLQNRMNLLISSSMISKENLVSLILHLSNQYTKSFSSSIVLKQIYFAFPSLLKSIISNYSPFLIQNHSTLSKQQPPIPQQSNNNKEKQQTREVKSEINNIILSNEKTQIPNTQLDIILHRVILKISDTNNENRNSGFIIIRKLAIIHPELITLYLPSIHSLLSGRSDTPLDQFISRNYHLLFLQVLELLVILIPVVFDSKSFIPIINEYFKLFNLNSSTRIPEFVPMISRFCDLVLIFIDHKNQNIDLLVQNKDIIKSLSNFYPIIQLLLIKIKPNQLMTTLNSLYQFNTFGNNSNGVSNYQQQQQSINQQQLQLQLQQHQQQTQQYSHNQYQQQQPQPQQQQPIINEFKDSIPFKFIKNEKQSLIYENEKTVQQLDEIIKLTHNVPSQLGYLKDELLLLIQSDYYNIRNKSYFLIQKYLQYCPQDVESMIDGYLNCFKHWNPDVIKDAIQHSQDFYYLSSNDRSEYLIEQILIYGGKDSVNEIKKLINPFCKIFY